MNKEINLKKPKIGLALGSGAARGLTHIGALKAIEECGIKIDYISGCSIGALIGGAYAKGMSVSEIEDFALQTNWKLMSKVFLPTFSLSSLINDSYIVEILNSIIGKTTFEELKIPFSAITTNIHTGKMVVLEKGNLLNAIRASISIPILLSPVTIGKHKLVDGGLVNPTPVDIVKKKKMDKVIAVNLRQFSSYGMFPNKIPAIVKPNVNIKELSLNEKMQYFIKHPIDYVSNNSNEKTPDPKFWEMIYQMLIIIQVQVGDLSLQINRPDILIEPDTSGFKAFDFNKAKELIEVGYIASMKQLENFQTNLVF
jgi:NTE family protein